MIFQNQCRSFGRITLGELEFSMPSPTWMKFVTWFPVALLVASFSQLEMLWSSQFGMMKYQSLKFSMPFVTWGCPIHQVWLVAVNNESSIQVYYQSARLQVYHALNLEHDPTMILLPSIIYLPYTIHSKHLSSESLLFEHFPFVYHWFYHLL